MQVTSSGYSSVVNSPYRSIGYGVLVSFTKNIASNIRYFTVNVSTIGGDDIILGGGGGSVSFFDKYQYTDYSRYIKNWSVDRKIGQFPFGLVMAQADVELDNSSKLFLPGYDTTIGSGILPNRPMKITTQMGQDSLQQFTGFTGQPELSITNRNMLLHAYDVVDYLNNYSFTSQSGTTFSGMLTNITTASAISYYLGKLGFNSNQTRLDRSLQSQIGVVNVTDRKFGDVLSDLVTAEQGLLFADENGIINFWNRQHFNTIAASGTLFNFNYSNCIDIRYSNAPIINNVRVTAKPRAVDIYQQIWKQSSYQTLAAGQSTDVFIDFTDEDGALPVTSVTLPSYSAGLMYNSYYTTNASNDGSGATLDSYVSITSSYLFGKTYKLTFFNSYSSAVYVTDMVIYGTPVKVLNRFVQQYSDQSSIDAYGQNPANNGQVLDISNDYIQSATDALNLGFSIVSQFGQPNRHYEVDAFSDPARQIGDYGTITLPDSGQTKTVWITGKTDKLSPGGSLTQTLQLEERTLFSYFTINVSVIGGTDVIAI